MNMSTSTHDLFDFFKKANSNISDEYTRICRKSRGRRNTGGVNEHQRNLPAYDKSSDAERRMETTIRINGSFSE